MGFVQCEQQKYQNKYGYNQKCHSNTICTNDIKYHRYLFIYYYHYFFCFGLSLFFLLLRTAIVVAVAVYLLLAIWIGYLIRIRIGIWKPSFTFDKNTIHSIQIDWSDWANLIEKSIYNSIEVWGMTMIQIWYLLYRKVFPTCSIFMRWGRKCGRIRFSLFVHLCMCVCVCAYYFKKGYICKSYTFSLVMNHTFQYLWHPKNVDKLLAFVEKVQIKWFLFCTTNKIFNVNFNINKLK